MYYNKTGGNKMSLCREKERKKEMKRIKFGTDGWRAVIAEDFTFANVRRVARAIALYVRGTGLAEKGVVIGYDNRFLSERFAAAVAEVMAGSGIPCWLTVAATPTPVTAYAVKALDTGGAVMITASHNPPEYNGIKFIPDYAGPATTEITAAIERFLDTPETAEEVPIVLLERARERGLVRDLDARPLYLQHLRRLLDLHAIGRGRLRIVLDPMWGAGIGYVEEILKGVCSSIEVIHNHRDVLFGGALPEPTAAELSSLREMVLEKKADLGLALDGDADRFGVIDRGGEYLSPNEVLALLLYYLLEHRRWRGAVARTLATTHLLDRIAEDYGLPVVETPVGFKYIGQSLIHHRSILGGEESGGMSIQGHIPEKDGILALVLIVEMISATGKSLRQLQEEIYEKFGRLVSTRLDIKCDHEKKEEILKQLEGWYPAAVGGTPVADRSTRDGVKLLLEDGSWILVRPSGTEPLFRVYVEAPNREALERLQESVRKDLGL
jgi:alpha-D-glucose phosphate-specific phosphoglucomutase